MTQNSPQTTSSAAAPSRTDFFLAGRWRNKANIIPVLDAIRANGKTAYCFIEHDYYGEAVEFKLDDDPEAFMEQFEKLPQNHPLVRKIFDADIAAQRVADAFVLVLPAGIAGHIEAGAAYGMGQKVYAIGQPEKVETLYCIFDQIFPDLPAFEAWLKAQET